MIDQCVGCKHFIEANHFKVIEWPFFWRKKTTDDSMSYGACRNYNISLEANTYTFATLKRTFCKGDHFTPQTATEQ